MRQDSPPFYSAKPSLAEIQAKCAQALAFHQKGDFAQAQRLYLDILKHQPKHADALHLLGVIAYQKKNNQRAVDLITKAIEVNPNNPIFYLNHGNALLANKQPQVAISSYKQAISRKNNYVEAYTNLGSALRQLRQFEVAIENYNQAIRLKPDHIDAYLNRGNTLQELSRFKEAIEDYNKVISINPAFAKAYFNRGNAFKELNLLEAAIASFNTAIKIKPDAGEAHNNLGLIFSELGHYEKAIECLTQAELLQAVNFKRSHLLECTYRVRDQDAFNKVLRQFSPLDHLEPLSASLISHASIKYEQADSNQFCQHPMDFVALTQLREQDGLTQTLIKQTIQLLHDDDRHTRGQSLLTNGIQTAGNLFNSNLKCIAELKDIIMRRIYHYQATYQDSQQGMFKHWPKDHTLYGWLISMQQGGQLSAHIHNNAWVSGCLYISMPEKDDHHSGDIKFGLDGGGHETGGKIFPSKLVEVKERDLLLFPSSLFHGTIPFSGSKNRISLAFDLRPSDKTV
jgi:tetratricopeptide (TPR) repeat protein